MRRTALHFFATLLLLCSAQFASAETRALIVAGLGGEASYEQAFQRHANRLGRALGEDHPNSLDIRRNLVDTLLAARRLEDARDHARRLLELTASDAPEHAERSNLLQNIEAVLKRD